MDLKEHLLNRAMRWMQDPRVVKALQDPRVMQGVMGAVQLRAKVQQNLEGSGRLLAKRLNLATGAEVRELRRTIRRLERELDASRGSASPSAPPRRGQAPSVPADDAPDERDA